MPSAADDKSRGTRGARRRSDRKAGRQRHETQCRRPTRRLRRITGVIGHGGERRASPAAPRGASPPRIVPATTLVRAASISRTWWLLAASFFLSLGTLLLAIFLSLGHPTNPNPNPNPGNIVLYSPRCGESRCGPECGGVTRVCSEIGVLVCHTCLWTLRDFYSTGTRDRGQARVCALENRTYSSKGRSYPKGRGGPPIT